MNDVKYIDLTGSVSYLHSMHMASYVYNDGEYKKKSPLWYLIKPVHHAITIQILYNIKIYASWIWKSNAEDKIIYRTE